MLFIANDNLFLIYYIQKIAINLYYIFLHNAEIGFVSHNNVITFVSIYHPYGLSKCNYGTFCLYWLKTGCFFTVCEEDVNDLEDLDLNKI